MALSKLSINSGPKQPSPGFPEKPISDTCQLGSSTTNGWEIVDPEAYIKMLDNRNVLDSIAKASTCDSFSPPITDRFPKLCGGSSASAVLWHWMAVPSDARG